MKRKLLAILLSLAMLFSLLPPGAAMATDEKIITVGDVSLQGVENSPVYATTSDGKVQLGSDEQSYNIKWDGKTLTLRNAEVVGTSLDHEVISYHYDDFNIELIGNNEITSTSEIGVGIAFSGNLTISAAAESPNAQLNARGISNGITSSVTNGTLTIESGTINSNKIYVCNSISINGGSVTVDGGISTPGTMTIANTAALTAYGTSVEAINAGEGITISGGEVIASSVGARAFTEYTDYIDIVPPEDTSITVHYGENSAAVTTQTYATQTRITDSIKEAGYFHSYLTSISEPTITGVVVSPETATVQQGNTQPFNATVTGSGNLSNAQIQWSVTGSNSASNGTSISDSGLLSVAADEKAESLTVTATVTAGEQTFTDTATVTVGKVKAKSITVEPSAITLMVGQTYQLKAIVDPPEAAVNVTWMSNDLNQATVDENGLVTAIASGYNSFGIAASVGVQTSNWCSVKVVAPIISVGGVGFYSDGSTSAYGRTSSDGTVTTEGATESNYNIKWDGSTLTLRNATIVNNDGVGIQAYYGAGRTMTALVIEGQNTITASGNGIQNDHLDGLTILGSGSLSVSGGENGMYNVYNYDDGLLTINSGTVIATGGTYGINSRVSINICGGDVTAIGGAQGIYRDSNRNIVINPSEGNPIAVTAGEKAESAAAITGSPFTSETTITDLLSEKKYVHTEVIGPPSITIQPQSATVTEGESASFSLAASGSGLSYQWQQSSDGGQSWLAISSATSDSYNTGATSMAMNGTQYRCVITNAAGSVTSVAATLIVQEKPEPVDPDPTPTPDPDPTPTPEPEPEGPATDGSEGWTDIEDEIADADDGDALAIDMNGTTEVPKEIFEAVAGKDVDVTFELEDGVSWTVNGTDIPTDADLNDLDLGVTMDSDGIPVNVINTITGERDSVQMTLAHDGEFGFTMTLSAPLGKENAGYWANLYHYDEDAEAMSFEVAAEIDDDGNVKLPMSHASQYAIVIDDHSHAAEEPADLPFTDVNDDDWFSDVVRYVYEQGLMTGTSDREFSPNLTTTRGMIVSILNRLEGGPTAEAAGFTDVADGDWYADAVNWAASEGIIAGYEDNTFRPNDPITREQLAAMLMNYAAWKGEDVNARADLSSYNDVASVSSWAAETVQWAVAEGLISGMPGNLLEPQGSATRAQVAAILERFLEQ